MYVWADEPRWDGATRAEWARLASLRSCRELSGETTAHWPYSKYAVLINGDPGGDVFLRWDSTGSCTV